MKQVFGVQFDKPGDISVKRFNDSGEAQGRTLWRPNAQGVQVRYHYDGSGELDDDKGQPAVEAPGQYRAFYQHGKLHKEDGPAVEYADGKKEYWVLGQPLSPEEFEAYQQTKATKEVKAAYRTPKAARWNSSTQKLAEDFIHSLPQNTDLIIEQGLSWSGSTFKTIFDGKAQDFLKTSSLKLAWEVEEDSTPVTDSGGTTYWYNSAGELHRTDGPAVEYADGSKAWYVDGKRHRTDGPAIELADGSKEWYVDGRRLTEEEFNRMHQASLKLAWEVELENLKAPDLETHVKPWQCWEVSTETDDAEHFSFQSYLYFGAHPKAYLHDVAMAVIVEDALEQPIEPTLKVDTELLVLMHRFDDESQGLSGSPMVIVPITRSIKLIADDWRPVVGYGFRNASLRLADRFGNMNPGILDIQKRYLEGTATMHNTTQGVAL